MDAKVIKINWFGWSNVKSKYLLVQIDEPPNYVANLLKLKEVKYYASVS